ncbi:MAG: hypothetical protein ACRDQ4_20285 [Pseudonocardiaceae bacterium]
MEISRDADEVRARVYAAVPSVPTAQAALDEALTVVSVEFEALNEAHKLQRTRSLRIPDAAERRKRAQEEGRAARAALKDAEKRERLKAVFNDVVDHHRVAEQRLITRRAQGRAAQRRFRWFTGSGALAVQPQRQAGMQPQRQAGMPPRDPALMASIGRGEAG